MRDIKCTLHMERSQSQGNRDNDDEARTHKTNLMYCYEKIVVKSLHAFHTNYGPETGEAKKKRRQKRTANYKTRRNTEMRNERNEE